MIKRRWLNNLPLHFMILPGLLLIIVFHYTPMAGIVIAFQKFIPTHGFTGSKFIGWDNFRYVFLLPDTLQAIRNTVIIALLKIVAGMVAPIITAILLNELAKVWFKRTIQTLVYLPHFLSWVILGGILIDILSPSTGIVNLMLERLGIGSIFFLTDPQWFRFILVISDVWKEFGFGTIIYLAALTSINPALYEAAMIDGASRIRQAWHITLPGIAPVIVLLVTLSLGSILNAGFDQVFNLYNPLVYQTGDIIDTLVYRMGLLDQQYGPATAIGLFKSVVSLGLISLSYYLAYKLANYRIF